MCGLQMPQRQVQMHRQAAESAEILALSRCLLSDDAQPESLGTRYDFLRALLDWLSSRACQLHTPGAGVRKVLGNGKVSIEGCEQLTSASQLRVVVFVDARRWSDGATWLGLVRKELVEP